MVNPTNENNVTSVKAPRTVMPLSKRATRMLADMGIDLWASRSAGLVRQEAPYSVDVSLANKADRRASDRPPENLSKPTQSLSVGTASARVGSAVAEPDVSAHATVDLNDGDKIEPIHFYYVYAPHILCISHEPPSQVVMRFLPDLAAVLGDAAQTDSSPEMKVREFQWPLIETTGNPKRALNAFIEKYSAHRPSTLCLIEDAAMDGLSPWLGDTVVALQKVTSLNELATQAKAKKQLWQSIAKLPKAPVLSPSSTLS